MELENQGTIFFLLVLLFLSKIPKPFLFNFLSSSSFTFSSLLLFSYLPHSREIRTFLFENKLIPVFREEKRQGKRETNETTDKINKIKQKEKQNIKLDN